MGTYREVLDSGLGSLQCLGAEVYGKWGHQYVRLVPALAREYTATLHPRIRRGMALGLQHRWWGILGVALQSAVARGVLHHAADLPQVLREAAPSLTDLEMV